MSEANGTLPGSEAVKPVNRMKRSKGETKGTGAFYERMGKLCAKKSLALTASDTEAKVTITVASFPGLSREAITEAAAGGVKVVFKPTDKVDGKTASASGSAEGEAGSELADAFFGIVNVD